MDNFQSMLRSILSSPWVQSSYSNSVLYTQCYWAVAPVLYTGSNNNFCHTHSVKDPQRSNHLRVLYFSLVFIFLCPNSDLKNHRFHQTKQSFQYILLKCTRILKLRKLSNLSEVRRLPRGEFGLLELEETFEYYLPIFFMLCCPWKILFMWHIGFNEWEFSDLRKSSQAVLLLRTLSNCPKGWGDQCMEIPVMHLQHQQMPACIPVEKVYSSPLMLRDNHETEREAVGLKQYNQLLPEPEQKLVSWRFPSAINSTYDDDTNSNNETQRN